MVNEYPVPPFPSPIPDTHLVRQDARVQLDVMWALLAAAIGVAAGPLVLATVRIVPATGPERRALPAGATSIICVTAMLFGLVTLRLRQLDAGAAVPAFLYFTAMGMALSVIDVRHHRLPRRIVAPSYPVVGALLALAAAVTPDWTALARAGLGACALFGYYLFIALIHPAGMGFGDVTLAGLVGGVLAYLSWTTLVVGAFAGFLLGALWGMALVVTRRGGRKTVIAFGPFMFAGALLAVFVTRTLA
jgi:prepilin signal peptidase PulO-like enzyme (type II secretory pathway)